MVFFRFVKNFFQKEEPDVYSKVKPEKSREFYLKENESYQYIPKSRLPFQDSYLQLYKYRGVTFKFFYMVKVPLPSLFLLGVAQGNHFGNMNLMIFFTAVASLGLAALHSTLACRIAKEINLHEDGDKVEVVYSLFNLVERKKVHQISEFRNQLQHPLMWMWSLHPVPKNILAGIEGEMDQMLPIFAQKKFGFYLLHGKPVVSHQDLLINVLNGVIIDTKAFTARVNYFKDRYRVLK